MLDEYCSMNVFWEAKDGINEYNEGIYKPPLVITARKVTQDWIKHEGISEEEKIPLSVYYCVQKINEGDLLDGREVVHVKDMISLDGSFLGCKCRV